MLVKVKIGGRDAPDTVIAKPAYYEDESDAARVYYYYGPLDPERWSEIRYANRDEEKVVEETILKQSVISAFSTYETELDALPLRDLPLWAKELWVKDRERYRPGHVKDATSDYMKVEAMKMLIDEEREQGGLNPNDMSADMQGRYLHGSSLMFGTTSSSTLMFSKSVFRSSSFTPLPLILSMTSVEYCSLRYLPCISALMSLGFSPPCSLSSSMSIFMASTFM